MARGPRLDAPGTLHHVIVRGIERRPIFEDDRDHEDFLRRLGAVVEQGQAHCFARELGLPGGRLSEMLRITPAGVHFATERGEELLEENSSLNKSLRSYLTNLTTSP